MENFLPLVEELAELLLVSQFEDTKKIDQYLYLLRKEKENLLTESRNIITKQIKKT